MRAIIWVILLVAAWGFGLYCGITPDIVATLATVPALAQDYAGNALAFLYANPIVAIPIAIGVTALVFILYQRYQWSVFDKIRGKTTATTVQVRDEFSSQALRETQQAAALTEQKEAE